MRSEGLDEVKGSGGSKHKALEMGGSSGDGRKLWGWQEALGVAGSSRGGRNLWTRLEAVEGCCGGSKKSLEAAGSSGGSGKVWRRMQPIAYSSPTRRCLRLISCAAFTSGAPFSSSSLSSTTSA